MIFIVVFLVVLVVFVLKQSYDPENLRKYQAAQEAKSKAEESQKESDPLKQNDRFVEDLNIPVVILPNLYSLNISNLSLKHIRSRISERSVLDYVTLKCKVNYRLNGRKEGKRKIIFTSYNDKDEVVEIRGECDTYKFTEAGYEFVEASFDDYDKKPISKISISVKEI